MENLKTQDTPQIVPSKVKFPDDGMIGTPLEQRIAIASVKDFEQRIVIRTLKEVMAGQRQTSMSPRSDILLGEYLDRWVRRYPADRRTGGSGGYRSILENHLKPGLGRIPLQRLTTSLIQDFIDSVKSVKEGKDLSPVTKKHILACLHRALEVAVNEDLLDKNLADRVEVKGAYSGEVNPLKEEDLNTLLAARQITFFELIATDAMTGLRRGELLALKWKDFTGDSLRIERSYDDRNHRFKDCKNHEMRSLDLYPHTQEVLRQYYAQSKHTGPDDLIFCNQNGKPLNPAAITRSFSKSLKSLGLLHIRLHDLRHTHATWLLANGWDIKSVQVRLGHKDPEVTLKTYAHYIPGRQKQLIQEQLERTGVACKSEFLNRVSGVRVAPGVP